MEVGLQADVSHKVRGIGLKEDIETRKHSIGPPMHSMIK